MLTGFNTDIDFNGRVYHVQTEDRGLASPVVESLVYCGGEIVTARKNSYEDLVAAGYADGDLLQRMELQHRELIREIRAGEFESEELKPFGHEIVTNRGFDRVVLEFLAENISLEPIRLDLQAAGGLVAGSRQTIRFTVVEVETDRPVPHATIVAEVVATGSSAQSLFEGVSDGEGRVEAEVEIPALTDANAALVCRVRAEGRTAELKQLIRKAAEPSHPA